MEKKLDKIKAIFLDIDGTLTTSNKIITDYTKNVLKKLKENGIYAILCSGRANSYVCDLSKRINASEYVISNNGAYVYNYKDDKEIFLSYMDLKKIEKIWCYCEKEGIEILMNLKDKRYANDKAFSRFAREAIKINSFSEIKNEKIPQIVLEAKKEEQSIDIKKIIEEEKSIKIANYGKSKRLEDEQKRIEYFFDVNNEGVDKGIAIEKLISFLKIQKDETICFGDSINDYSMFQKCGTSVAMANAKKELKDIADYITLTNDEDGVAKFIEEKILK